MEITEDHSMMNMRFIRKLPVPKEVKELYPLSEKGAAAKAARDAEIAKVLRAKAISFCLLSALARQTGKRACSIMFTALQECRSRLKIKL